MAYLKIADNNARKMFAQSETQE